MKQQGHNRLNNFWLAYRAKLASKNSDQTSSEKTSSSSYPQQIFVKFVESLKIKAGGSISIRKRLNPCEAPVKVRALFGRDQFVTALAAERLTQRRLEQLPNPSETDE